MSAVLAALALAVAAAAGAGEAKMEAVGRIYLFDYGQIVIRVRYVSAGTLTWEQVKGPQAGLKGEEKYGVSVVRPHVYFVWWQEKDTSIVTQVVDLEKKRVHTAWISPQKELATFEGTIRDQP